MAASISAVPVAPLSFEDTRIAFEAKSDTELRKMYALFAAMNSGSLV
ncbi:MAG: proline dehydrogenase, partial [Hymenobacter sp.]